MTVEQSEFWSPYVAPLHHCLMSRVEGSDVCHIFQDCYCTVKKKTPSGGRIWCRNPWPSTKFQPGCDQEQKHFFMWIRWKGQNPKGTVKNHGIFLLFY